MKAQEQTFRQDEVIFREGEPSTAVYVIGQGKVQVSKLAAGGSVVLAVLGNGDMFGEMGIMDDSPRSATARALEPTRCKVIPREEFKAWLSQQPETAQRIMGLMAERLRNVSAHLVQRRDEPDDASSSGRFGFLRRLLRRRVRRSGSGAAPTAALAPPPSFTIVLAALNGDPDGHPARAKLAALGGRPGLRLLTTDKAVPSINLRDSRNVGAAGIAVRQILTTDPADLVLWGDVTAEGGIVLHISAPIGADEERPGTFGLINRLELPPEDDDKLFDLVYACVLAAIEPEGEQQRQLQRQWLAPAAAQVEHIGQNPPTRLDMWAQIGLLMGWGHVAATLGNGDAPADKDPAVARYEQSAAAYRAALRRLPRGAADLEDVAIRRPLATLLMALAERSGDPAHYEEAVATYRAALESMPKALYPVDWAMLQNRLGLALYKWDLNTGQTARLKESFQAFQQALSVFSRTEHPWRWADAMHNLAQTLQIYGGEMRSVDVLERAVEASRAVLDVRTRQSTPLGFAATLNTLGAALYLIDKHADTVGRLDEATLVLRESAEIYRALNLPKLAAVPERNLAQVDKLLKSRPTRKVMTPDWAPED